MDDLYIYRIVSNMNSVVNEYSKGNRIFDKYDIEDNYAEFFDFKLEDTLFSNCFIEACFTRCSFKNSKFLNSNLKTLVFKECDLTNTFFNECAIESIDFERSVLEDTKFGTNYAYGVTLVNKY